MRRLVLLCCLALALPIAAHADTIYTYSGKAFTFAEAPFATTDSVHGSFSVSTPLSANLALPNIYPVSYSFTDGLDTFTQSNSDSSFTSIYTDATGMITGWAINLDLSNGTGVLGTNDYSYNSGGDAGLRLADGRFTSYGNNSVTGSWTISTTVPLVAATPEPSSLLLLGTGFSLSLSGLALAPRRR